MSEGNPLRPPEAQGRRSVLRLAAYLASPRIETVIDRVEGAVESTDTTLRNISTSLELATHIVAPVSRKDFVRSLLQLTLSGDLPLHFSIPSIEPTEKEHASLTLNPHEESTETSSFDDDLPREIAVFPTSSQEPDDWYQEKPIFDL